MTNGATADLVKALRRLGLVRDDEAVRLTPLTGGVSSDIHLAETSERRFCVKRALPRLKVAAVWEAPIGRNAAEAAWLRTVRRWLPNAVPEVLAEDAGMGLFAMPYLPPDAYPVWKTKLLAGEIDVAFAASVGSALCTIHRRSAGDPHLAEAFANDGTFEAIRLEPYLRATARRHPDLAERLHALADATLATRRALVHGDVSPKNILCGPSGPVFLDAECAWYGDPVFDLAFCLNHLLLKGAWRPELRTGYLRAFHALVTAYLAGIDWEQPAGFERRCAELLPGLFLARVDGKSPVEYLTDEAAKEAVRRAARALLKDGPKRLDDIADFWDRSRCA
jgi:5-methylthioribose kinase